MTREMGKVIKETRGDIQTAIDVAKFIAGEGRRAEGETIPSALNNKFCMTIRQPLGVVGTITPWNFPLAIPAWKTFPAPPVFYIPNIPKVPATLSQTAY
jgi:acyl-CoA reductase-like NAD-dependent aldehyde dehydrogenase